MRLCRLWLADFRSYPEAEITFGEGLTAIVGANGNGKTNVLEAIAFLATTRSFRGSPNDAMIRVGAKSAVVRAEITDDDRDVLIEAEIPPTGRARVQVNKQRLTRTRDLLGVFDVTVFSPDDLEIVKGGPAGRREYLDRLLVSVHPKNEQAVSDFERVLRQRNALLRQMAGRRGSDDELTLEVWDTRLVETGERLALLRAKVVEQLFPLVTSCYEEVAERGSDITMVYEAPWRAAGLGDALSRNRGDDIRRGVSLVGPHRDELAVSIEKMPSRTHSSQGEQRSLTLAMRLAAHRLVMQARGHAPVLLLDDVFSELDHARSRALLASLPAGQGILTSATELPAGATPELLYELSGGRLTVG